jgi:hypothetical protein
MSRPTIYSAELAGQICDLLMQGNSLRSICKMEGMPDKSTVCLWLKDNREGFFDQYARAREVQMELMAEEIIDIADQSDKDEQAFVGINHVHRARLKVETRKWIMSKLAMKRFGDKLDLNHSGAVDVKKVTVEIVGSQAQGE